MIGLSLLLFHRAVKELGTRGSLMAHFHKKSGLAFLAEKIKETQESCNVRGMRVQEKPLAPRVSKN